MPTPENRVKALVKKLLDQYGDDAYREMPVPSGFGKSGLDFTICFLGRFIAVETKRPGAEPTERQWLRIREIRRAGGAAFVVDGPETLKPLEHYLRKIARDAACKSKPQTPSDVRPARGQRHQSISRGKAARARGAAVRRSAA